MSSPSHPSNDSPDGRRQFLKLGLAAAAASAALPHMLAAQASSAVPSFELGELTLDDLRQGLASGKYTARNLAEKYLARIEAIDRQGPSLKAVLEVNPDALQIADALDQERRSKGARGPLHGIPVIIKDNISTRDKMQSTAGSLALVGSRPPRDAALAARLRDAGALILGKSNLSEWANFRSSHSTSGWSGRGGQTRNPYALNRNPSGSSSGSAVAVSAGLCAVAIGSETDGSIVSPSNNNGIVGIKPTVGLVSRAGIIPISHTQDTAGPMGRTVADAVALLQAIAGFDPADPATALTRTRMRVDYSKSLDRDALKGARLGVVRKLAGYDEHVDSLFAAALDTLKNAGAVLVDPADIPTIGKVDDHETQVLLFEFKADLNRYLAALGPDAPVHTLEEIIAFNDKHYERELTYFGQDLMQKAQAKGPLTDPKYVKALAACRRLSRAQGIDFTLKKFRLDGLVAPTGNAAWPTDLINGDHFSGGSSSMPAVAGYPHITVPMGFIFGLPVGLSFFAGAWSEPALIKFAYAYEQLTHHRRPPQFLPTAEVPT